MALEDLIREAAAKGLTHLSLHPVHSEDRKTVYWRCTATPSTMHKYVHVTTTDPVEAMLAVLASLPKAGRRKALTAAVSVPPSTITDEELREDLRGLCRGDPAPHSVPDPQEGPENELETWLPKM